MIPKRLYHGTARAFGVCIEQDGLSPVGCASAPPEFRKSCYSEPGYVYFYDNPELAEHFACGVAQSVGLGTLGQVFIVENKLGVETDPLLPKCSWRHKGKIPPELLKTYKIVDCTTPNFSAHPIY